MGWMRSAVLLVLFAGCTTSGEDSSPVVENQLYDGPGVVAGGGAPLPAARAAAGSVEATPNMDAPMGIEMAPVSSSDDTATDGLPGGFEAADMPEAYQVSDNVFDMGVVPELPPTTTGAAGGLIDLIGSVLGGGGSAPRITGGTCCPDGNCICHNEPPLLSIGAGNGPYRVGRQRARTGTLFYPTNAEPPFAGVAICPGFLNFGPEMNAWGTFYASHGIVTMVTNVSPVDLPAFRATKLLASVDEMKRLDGDLLSPIGGKMAGWYGTSGYSMGGGGTTIAAARTPSLKSSVGLATWGPSALGTQVPTLLLCGSIDAVAPCLTSQSAYNQIPATTPKAMVTVPLAGHLAWFGPSSVSGQAAIAWQKVHLEGDTRWQSALTSALPLGSRSSGLR